MPGAGTEFARGFVTLAAELGGLKQGLMQGQQAVTSAVGNMQRALGGIQGMFGALGVGIGFGALLSQAKGMIREGQQAVDVQKQLEASLASTGYAVGFTGDQLADYAMQLQSVTTMGDEHIKQVMTGMLQFRQVTGETFKAAVKAALDFEAAGKGSAIGLSRMFGRALEMPERAGMMLTRMGVSFTDAERSRIKELVAGNQKEAARLIVLQKLQASYKGVAEEMAKTDSGKIKQLTEATGDLREEIGIALMPLMVKWMETQKSVMEGLRDLTTKATPWLTGMATLWGKANDAMGGWLNKGAMIVTLVGVLGGAWYLFGNLLMAMVIPAIKLTAAALVFLVANPVGMLITKLAILGYLFFNLTSVGQKAAADIKASWTGMQNAISAGEWTLAFQISFLQIRVWWYELIDAMLASMPNVTKGIMQTFNFLSVNFARLLTLWDGRKGQVLTQMQAMNERAIQEGRTGTADARAELAAAMKVAEEAKKKGEKKLGGVTAKRAGDEGGAAGKGSPFIGFAELNKRIQEALLNDPVLEATEEGNEIMGGIAEDVAAIAGREEKPTSAAVTPKPVPAVPPPPAVPPAPAVPPPPAPAVPPPPAPAVPPPQPPAVPTPAHAVPPPAEKAPLETLPLTVTPPVPPIPALQPIPMLSPAVVPTVRIAESEEEATALGWEPEFTTRQKREKAIQDRKEAGLKRREEAETMAEFRRQQRQYESEQQSKKRERSDKWREGVAVETFEVDGKRQVRASGGGYAFVEAGPRKEEQPAEKPMGYRQIKASGELTRSEQLGGITRGWQGPTQIGSTEDISRRPEVQARAEEIMQEAGGALKMTFSQALYQATQEVREPAVAEGRLKPNANDQYVAEQKQRREETESYAQQVHWQFFSAMGPAIAEAGQTAFVGLADLFRPIAEAFQPGQDIPGREYLTTKPEPKMGVLGSAGEGWGFGSIGQRDIVPHAEKAEMENDVRKGTDVVVETLKWLGGLIEKQKQPAVAGV